MNRATTKLTNLTGARSSGIVKGTDVAAATFRKIDIGDRPRVITAIKNMPELLWVPIKNIRVDDSYQRPILRRGWKQIEWIAANFNWASFTPVLLSQISDGFALIDGQHRTHAAYLAGYDKVPALVVEVSQVKQAAAFARVNGNVTQISLHNIYKAALVAGEKWAVESDRVVSKAGCRLMTSNGSTANKQAGEIYAVSLIRDMVLNMEGEAVTAGLRGLRESQTGTDVELWSAFILKPWLSAVASNSAYLHTNLKQALDKTIDLYLLHEKASKEAKLTRESRPPILRRMICKELDRYRGAK